MAMISTYPSRRCSYSKTEEICDWYRFCDWKDGKCVVSTEVDTHRVGSGMTLWEIVGVIVAVQLILLVLTLMILSYPSLAEKIYLFRIWAQSFCRQWCLSLAFCAIVHRYMPQRSEQQQPQYRQNHHEQQQGLHNHELQQPLQNHHEQQQRRDYVSISVEPLLFDL